MSSGRALEGALVVWRSVGALAVALGLTACVQPSTRPIIGPDGQATLFVSCAETGECYELAGRECPNGYDIQPAEGATHGGGYLVRCRRAAAAAPPTYYDPRSASTAVVPGASAYYAGTPAESPPFTPYTAPSGVAHAPPPPPPPPPPPSPGPEASTPPNQLSMPRPIGSGEPDLGY